MPDWVAQRLWMGTISLLAALGARWLFRVLGARRWGALAGALVYMLTPYQLAFTARISVLLLAWAALPWIVGLTMRAVHRGGWAYPAALALVIMSAGQRQRVVDAVHARRRPRCGSLLELGDAPRCALGRAAAAVGRIARADASAPRSGGSSVCASQGADGLPVLQLTETVRVVASASTPLDLLRGLGNWFFYGTDRVGDSIQQAHDYVTNHLVHGAQLRGTGGRAGRGRDRAMASPHLPRAARRGGHGDRRGRLAVRRPQPLRAGVEVVLRQRRRWASRCATRRGSRR